MIFLE